VPKLQKKINETVDVFNGLKETCDQLHSFNVNNVVAERLDVYAEEIKALAWIKKEKQLDDDFNKEMRKLGEENKKLVEENQALKCEIYKLKLCDTFNCDNEATRHLCQDCYSKL
jgi:hypothetical protein